MMESLHIMKLNEEDVGSMVVKSFGYLELLISNDVLVPLFIACPPPQHTTWLCIIILSFLLFYLCQFFFSFGS